MSKDNHISQFYPNGSSRQKPNKRYLISAKNEILHTIKNLKDQSKLVTVYLENSNQFIITAMLEIDEKNYCIYIDKTNDHKKNDEIIANPILTITSQSNGIKYLFPVNVIGKTMFENNEAIKVSLPDYVLKLQRREFFRTAPPLDHAIKCQVNFDIGNMKIDIADISEGGLNLVDRNNALLLKPDTVLKSCRINLPKFGTIESDLKIHRVTYPDSDPKKQTKYIGCEYIKPSNMMTSVIRRYIWKVERYNRSSDKIFN